MNIRSEQSKSKTDKVKRFDKDYAEIAQILEKLGLSRNASRILAYLHQMKKWTETIEFENALFNKRRRYLFQWREIPGKDNDKLLKFIGKTIHEGKVEQIEKFDNDTAIKINIEKSLIIIRLINKKNNAELKKIDNLVIWEDILGNDNEIVINYVTKYYYSRTYNTDWIKTANIEKLDDGKTIRLSSGTNYLIIKLNADTTEANLILDDGTNQQLGVVLENNKLKIYANTGVLKIFSAKKKKNELYIYDGARDRIIQPQIFLALKELRERGWISEMVIPKKVDEDYKELLFKRYKLKIGLDKIITQFEEEQKKRFDEATIKIQQLHGNEYEEIFAALRYFGITQNCAKILIYLKIAKEATTSEIINNTKINNSQLSVALKKLKGDNKRDWIDEREEKIIGKGRPHKIYSLKGGYYEYIAELEIKENKSFDDAKVAIKELGKLINKLNKGRFSKLPISQKNPGSLKKRKWSWSGTSML